MDSWSRAARGAVGLGLGLILAACGGGSGGKGAPSTAPPSSSSRPGVAGEPTTAPASGREVSVPGVSLRLPVAWSVTSSSAGTVVASRGPGTRLTVTSTDYAGEPEALSATVEAFNQGQDYDTKPTILSPGDVDGVRMFHEEGPVGNSTFVEAFGAAQGGHRVGIEFRLPSRAPSQRRTDLVDAVMETVETDL